MRVNKLMNGEVTDMLYVQCAMRIAVSPWEILYLRGGSLKPFNEDDRLARLLRRFEIISIGIILKTCDMELRRLKDKVNHAVQQHELFWTRRRSLHITCCFLDMDEAALVDTPEWILCPFQKLRGIPVVRICVQRDKDVFGAEAAASEGRLYTDKVKDPRKMNDSFADLISMMEGCSAVTSPGPLIHQWSALQHWLSTIRYAAYYSLDSAVGDNEDLPSDATGGDMRTAIQSAWTAYDGGDSSSFRMAVAAIGHQHVQQATAHRATLEKQLVIHDEQLMKAQKDFAKVLEVTNDNDEGPDRAIVASADMK